MARTKKTYETPTIEQIVKDVIISPVAPTTEQEPDTIVFAYDDSVITRRAPTMEVKHVVGKLVPGRVYRVKKMVHSAIYGDFYLLDNGYYISKIGNFTVKD